MQHRPAAIEAYTALASSPHLPLVLVPMLTMGMTIMEVIPGMRSVASAVIALFAAGLLTRDGALVLAALAVLGLVPLTLWRFAFAV